MANKFQSTLDPALQRAMQLQLDPQCCVNMQGTFLRAEYKCIWGYIQDVTPTSLSQQHTPHKRICGITLHRSYGLSGLQRMDKKYVDLHATNYA